MRDRTADMPIFLMKKIGGVTLLVLGLLLTAWGYGSESNALAILGVLLLAVGIALLALKIIRRNRP
jgi:drug/metabolite transporter (DMT)-like permease